MNNDDRNLDRFANEFKAAWQSGGGPRIEEYLNRVESRLKEQLLKLLIPLDVEHRLKAGENVIAGDYESVDPLALSMAQRALESQQGDPLATRDPVQRPGDANDKATPAERTPRQLAGGTKSQTIGPYKLLQKLGEGGMGEVWMAEQEKPVRRRVALKVIKAGLDNKQVIARFDAERQALAMMNHENIARILDGGTTETGQPYFVMELVQGIPFTKYCDQNKLSIKDRLELFIPVCKAIQHAHQKGIIHRDLKPSNVLVSLYDGNPVPKVIDFGLAKALEHTTHLTDKTMFTEFGQVVGTLQYMSPEQAEMNQLDIDTRTDIYSLGVMLYELLTGSTPIEAETLKKNAILQVLATIRETDPPRPSARLSSSTNEAVSGISSQRQIDPTKLKNILRGELDWIVMKSIEKDRSRRYETANGFADDIENYLTGDVVTARPPSTSYRIRKYIRRNKGLVASVASITMLLIAGIITTSWFAMKANSAKLDAVAKGKVADEKSQLALEEAQKAKAAEETAVLEREQTEATLARSNYFLANARWNENRAEESRALLEKIPVRFRKFEWYFDWRLYQGSTASLFGHRGQFNSVSVCPDGTKIVSGSSDGSIRLWDAETGTELWMDSGDGNELTCVSFSPDGKFVISGSQDETLSLRNIETGQKLHVLKGHMSRISVVTFSPDGTRIVSGDYDGKLKLWNATTGQVIQTLNGHEDAVLSLNCSPVGELIVSGSNDGTLKFWDAVTGEEKRTINGHDGMVMTVAFSPDGTRIVTGGANDNTLGLWNAVTGEEQRKLKGHTDRVACASFSPDGTQIVSGSADRTLKLWDAATGQELRTLQGHSEQVTSVCFSADASQVVSGSADFTIRIWDLTTDNATRKFNDATLVSSIGFSPDGKRLVSGSYDGTLTLWETASGQVVRNFNGQTNGIMCVSFSPDGQRIVSGNVDQSLTIWDVDTGSEVQRFEGHSNAVNCVRFSPDGTCIVSGSEDKTTKIWDSATGNLLQTFDSESENGYCVDFSPDGKQVVSGGWGTIQLWDVVTGQKLYEFNGHHGKVTSVCFSPDGKRILSGAWDNTLKLWNVEARRKILTLQGHTDQITGAGFNRDGTRIVSGSRDRTLRLWEAATGDELRTLTGHTDSFIQVSFSPDGTQFVSSCRDMMLMWRAAIGQELRTLVGHLDEVNAVRISPDMTKVVTGSNDSTLKLWDAVTGHEIYTFVGHSDGVYSIHFTADGKRIVSRDRQHETIVWDVASGHRIDAGQLADSAVEEQEPTNGRWLSLIKGNDVILIDRDYKNQAHERALLQRPEACKFDWHKDQAEKAEKNQNWLAAVFHRAWAMKADPNADNSWDNLHSAHQNWIKSAKDGKLPPLPRIVNQMLELRKAEVEDEEK